MPDSGGLAPLGELSKTATMLIEKIADAIGGIARPSQIRRVARAEADAALTHAIAQIQIADLQRRALVRFVTEEARKQQNIESITSKALPDVNPEAKPEN